VALPLAWQASLLDAGPPVPDAAFSTLRRTWLDGDSWVDHAPGWLSGADALFEELLAGGDWRQRTRRMYEQVLPEPRLTAGWDVDSVPALVAMARLLSPRYGVSFDRIWVNLYRDGRDSVAWHGDSNRTTQSCPLVATVSLGARRTFQLRRRGTTRIACVLEPAHGDLIVMGGRCQHDWEHTVPKTAKPVGPRMSVTIRHSWGGSGSP
jgi:alkylated DNA repair dioxygenase AlkB